MNERYTWVIQYEKPGDVPRAHAHMAALGGQVVAVQFADALDALTKTEAERDALRAELLNIGDLDKRNSIVRESGLEEWADWAQNRARHVARDGTR